MVVSDACVWTILVRLVNMVTSSLFDTKTHLSALINRVEREGETVIITRHGKPVARLVPYVDDLAEQRAAALAELRAAAKAAGIRYTQEQLCEPLPEEYWGVFAEPLPDGEVRGDAT